MSDEQKYPFELKVNFFASVSFKRANEVPQPIEMPVSTEINIAEPGFPILQVGLKVKSPDDSPLFFDVFLIGIFEYQGDKKEYDHELNVEYVFQRAAYLLWPNISQIVRVTTAQMGVNPLQVRNPITFGTGQVLQEKG
jgi:hypothetical protein